MIEIIAVTAVIAVALVVTMGPLMMAGIESRREEKEGIVDAETMGE